MTPTKPAAPPDRRWKAALIILCLTLLAPLLVVDVPPLLDYPNHLARAFVLASLPGDTTLAQFYAPHWSIIPNLALDLITPPLLHILPVHIAGRLLIATAILLPVLGTIAYNTALGGRYWSLGAGLVAYNDCLLYGFLNFEIALGLALLLAAAWLRWRETHPARAIALAILGAPILFACHLMGLVFFALLIGSAELFQLSRASIPRRAVILALIFATPAALYALSDLRQLGGDATFLPLGEKLAQLLTTFVNYNWPLDLATAITAIALPILGVALRWGRVPGPAAIAIALLLVIFLAAPFGWKGTFLLDTRFAVMLGFMLFAGFVPTNVPAPIRHTVTAPLILLFAARITLLTTAWFQHRSDLADLRAAMAPIRPGQAIYVAETGLDEAPAYWSTNPNHRLLSNTIRVDEHVAALVLIEHRAYWPFGFDNPSQQPIETREPYRTLANKIGSLPNRATTAAADLCGFDDVLLLAADATPPLPPGRFRLLARSGYAALYAITACNPHNDP